MQDHSLFLYQMSRKFFFSLILNINKGNYTSSEFMNSDAEENDNRQQYIKIIFTLIIEIRKVLSLKFYNVNFIEEYLNYQT